MNDETTFILLCVLHNKMAFAVKFGRIGNAHSFRVHELSNSNF